ncbi:MAG TPA: hypothetical protein VGQ00_03335 [Candidatus Norongarragalinales archaeon]|jgi:predicted RNase H-like nuclease (RuvC/YqgF family)|nr:hypothetical protein [Candidatus Norongarragalinales archaeon]
MVDPALLIAGAAVLAFDAYAYYKYKESKEALQKTATTQQNTQQDAKQLYPQGASLYEQLSPSGYLFTSDEGFSKNTDVHEALQDLSAELGSLRTQVQVLGTPSDFNTVKGLEHELRDLSTHKERHNEDIELLKAALEDIRDQVEELRTRNRRKLTKNELEQREKELQKLYMQRKIDEETFRTLNAELTRQKLDF